MTLFHLFLVFVYVGAFTIGGGLVAISLMQQQIVATGIITPEEFLNMIAISESTPGPVGINMATYVGYKLFGVLGSLVTTCGVVLPSLVCIIVIAKFFGAFQEKPLVKSIFYGLRAGSCGMIAFAVWQVLAVSLVDIPAFSSAAEQAGGYGKLFATEGALHALGTLFPPTPLVMAAVAAVVYRTGKIHPLLLIALGAVGGILFL